MGSFMSKKKRIIIVLFAVVAGVAAYFLFNADEPKSAFKNDNRATAENAASSEEIESKDTNSPPVEEKRNPSKSSSVLKKISAEQPAKSRPSLQTMDESSIMARLHELEFTDLEQSLDLAREGNDRFPDTPDAAERAWYVVRCLSRMGKFDEAKNEAKTMVERYPDTTWTSDVNRHVLAHP
jgi:hypothetical protein